MFLTFDGLGTASVIGPTNGGAHIVGAAQAPITYSEGIAVSTGGLGGGLGGGAGGLGGKSHTPNSFCKHALSY